MVPVYMDQAVAQGLGLSVYRNSEDSKVFVFLKQSVAEDLRLQWYNPAPAPPVTWSAVAAQLPPLASPQPIVQEEQQQQQKEEECFCANVQVPKQKQKAFQKLDGTQLSIHVDGQDIDVSIEIYKYEGDGDFDFTVLLWGTADLTPAENQREVFEELRRWLRFTKIHKFWHKGLNVPAPTRQDVYMWFQ